MTLYLSRLSVNLLDPTAHRTLSSTYRTHQAVMAAFHPTQRGQARVLYRVEPERLGGRGIILVQSPLEPDWPRAISSFFGDGCEAETRPFSLHVQPNAHLRFRLRANPTIKRQGKRLGLYACKDPDRGITTERVLEDWLRRKLEAAGCVPLSVQTVDEGAIKDRLPGGDGTLEFLSVRYDGILRVNDPDALADAVANGIGSAKGFGFGLLSLSRA